MAILVLSTFSYLQYMTFNFLILLLSFFRRAVPEAPDSFDLKDNVHVELLRSW